MVSELATNCIRHERTSFHITILGSDQEIRVEVTDSGIGHAHACARRAPTSRAGEDCRSSTCSPTPGAWSPRTRRARPCGSRCPPPRRWRRRPRRSARAGGSERRRAAFAGDPSTVQGAERTPNGPTSQHRRGTRRYRVPCGPRGAGLRSQGRPSGRRYCQHDESGCHARRRRAPWAAPLRGPPSGFCSLTTSRIRPAPCRKRCAAGAGSWQVRVRLRRRGRSRGARRGARRRPGRRGADGPHGRGHAAHPRARPAPDHHPHDPVGDDQARSGHDRLPPPALQAVPRRRAQRPDQAVVRAARAHRAGRGLPQDDGDHGAAVASRRLHGAQPGSL